MFPRPKYDLKIRPFVGKPIIKVLIGQRRVGKSYLLRLIRDEIISKGDSNVDIIHIDMEKDQFRDIKTSVELSDYLNEKTSDTSKKYVLIIDEIQEIDGFEKSIRSFGSESNFDIYITGSNSDILSGELATRLSGRYIEIPVFSLDFNEFCVFHDKAATTETLELYQKFGGLPFLIHLPMEDDIIYEYLKNIISTIVYKDVIGRYNVRNVHFLESLIQFTADNIGNILTAKKISDYLKSQKINIAVSTVLDYLTFLENSKIIHAVKRYDIKGKKLFEIGVKYYFQDIGIRNALTGYKATDIGKIMENIVFHHLASHGYDVLVGVNQQQEIDFIGKKKNEITYIQVAYLLSEESTINREFGNLTAINDNYKKMVVSMDPHSQNTVSGIEHWNLLNFLTSFK